MVKKFFKKYLLELILIGIICLISCLLLSIFMNKIDKSLVAKVYYYDGFETKCVKVIDLNSYHGNEVFDIDLSSELKITVEVKNNAIRVISAPCKEKVCENVGWTNNPNKPIVCLDLNYKIILYSNDTDLDVIV